MGPSKFLITVQERLSHFPKHLNYELIFQFYVMSNIFTFSDGANYLIFHVLVIRHGVWIDNRICWTLITRTHKEL
jgi:hypothetical protein